MILVDTSVWVDHLRFGSRLLETLLEEGEVLCHPFVVGELSCGQLEDRARTLQSLSALPSTGILEQRRVLELIEDFKLGGRGIGWVDAHLLAATLEQHCLLWASDRRLARIASELSVAA